MEKTHLAHKTGCPSFFFNDQFLYTGKLSPNTHMFHFFEQTDASWENGATCELHVLQPILRNCFYPGPFPESKTFFRPMQTTLHLRNSGTFRYWHTYIIYIYRYYVICASLWSNVKHIIYYIYICDWPHLYASHILETRMAVWKWAKHWRLAVWAVQYPWSSGG